MNNPFELFSKASVLSLASSTRNKQIIEQLQALKKWRKNSDVAQRREQKTWLLLFVALSLFNNVFVY